MLSEVYYVWQDVKTATIILNNIQSSEKFCVLCNVADIQFGSLPIPGLYMLITLSMLIFLSRKTRKYCLNFRKQNLLNITQFLITRF